VKENLIASGAAVSSVEDLRAACVDRLARALRALVSWEPDEYGETWVASDSTYAIVAFKTPGGGSAYVQFLSDPLHRTVLWEVSSADYQPYLATIVGPERERALFARGFSKGAPPSNYRREVVIREAAGARRVAAETLQIIFETLGYRGEPPLVLEVVAERIATTAVVHHRLTPEELAFMLRRWEYSAEVVRPDGEPPMIVVAGRSGSVFVVAPALPPAEYGYCASYTVRACLPRASNASREVLREWVAANLFTRALVDERGEAVLALEIDLVGGVTEAHLQALVRRFDEQLRSSGEVPR
jgi:hypothetical protein